MKRKINKKKKKTPNVKKINLKHQNHFCWFKSYLFLKNLFDLRPMFWTAPYLLFLYISLWNMNVWAFFVVGMLLSFSNNRYIVTKCMNKFVEQEWKWAQRKAKIKWNGKLLQCTLCFSFDTMVKISWWQCLHYNHCKQNFSSVFTAENFTKMKREKTSKDDKELISLMQKNTNCRDKGMNAWDHHDK